ncbi:MAG: flavin reductase family protein [Bradyrhizobium sp.]|nr:flavin reductase family protein [Bradyrhizobium sp.]
MTSDHQVDAAALVDSAAFKQALRGIAGTVSIVTSGNAPKRHGLTVTAACSVSVEPPTVLVCVNKSAGAHDTILQSKVFGLNVLASRHVLLAQKFAGLDGSKGDIRFVEKEWRKLTTGVPILADAVCSFDCRVIDVHAVGTHTVFLGAVLAEDHRDDVEALVYRQGQFAVPANLPPPA